MQLARTVSTGPHTKMRPGTHSRIPLQATICAWGRRLVYVERIRSHSRNVGLPRNYPTKTLSNWKKLIMTKAEQYFNIQVRRLDSNMRLGTDISSKTAMMSRQQATSAVHATMVARCWSSSLQRCMQMYMFTKNMHLMVLWYPIAWGFTPAACCTRLTSPILIGLCMTR